MPIYENSGCPSHSCSPAISNVLPNSLLYLGILQFFFKFIFPDAHFKSDFENLLVAQLLVVLEQEIVKGPEFSHALGSDACDSGFHGQRVSSQGKILENNFYFVRVFLEQLLEQRCKPRAVRSLKIIKHGDDHGGVFVPLEWRTGSIDVPDKI